jgi:2-dehydro-3-deoxyphosphogluconate aldolase/(4S)-4-hydroxy-2-oxoglutarate aldolase
MRAKTKVISDINYVGIVAVIRTDKPEQIPPVCEALVAGGVSILELTMTIPNALEALRNVIKSFGQRAIFGMGTIMDGKTARAAFEAGAEFVVTPIVKVEVAAAARTASRVSMIGAFTPTEAALAQEAGADYVKLFPADNLGPAYIRALRTPMPNLRLVPTGGVTLDNAADFLKAGAAALGVGSSLVTKQILEESNWAELTRLAGAYAKAVRQVKDAK